MIETQAAAPAHILVVDDDTRIRELLVSYLKDQGYIVTAAASASHARAHMKSLTFDLIILDIMMPGESGLDMTRSLRAENDNVPVLFLSALSDTDDRIDGLTAGGDDYLVKPFEPRELLLRIRNILRRQQVTASQRQAVSFGPFVLDLKKGELRRHGNIVHLTTRERETLLILARHSGQPVSRTDLSGNEASASTRGADVQINRLRSKIEDNPATPVYLQTVRGRGYVLHTD